MFGKLAFRNIRRSARDYLVYVLTMTFLVALMFAFNSIIFSRDIQKMYELAGMMAAMIGIATFFIVLIVAWLINYMVRFMLEKRSREFGIYLLIGMKKKQVSRLYMRENVLLGTGAFVLGLGLGMLLQQILMVVLYSVVQLEKRPHLEFNRYCLIMTVSCYAGCYLLALLRCKRRFRKMNIHDLMREDQKNEEMEEKHESIRKWLFPLSVGCILAFGVWILSGHIRSVGGAYIFLIGLFLSMYLFYSGLSAWIICYVKKKGRRIYRGQNLFLMRQFASKLKTMRFTMGTLTVLFTVAFLGCSVALMFTDWQKQVLGIKFPFDIQVYHQDPAYDFSAELEVIRNETKIKDSRTYRIWENHTDAVNTWLYTHLRYFGDKYKKADGTPDEKKIAGKNGEEYAPYDTFMALSDYNYLRQMLGYSKVTLGEDEYILQIKARIYNETGDFTDEIGVFDQGEKLTCKEVRTESFSQDGHNGGDYILVVPDERISGMNAYYSELAVAVRGKVPADLQSKLDDLIDGDDDDDEASPDDGMLCYGTDTIVSYSAVNLVRDYAIPEIRYMMTCITFPCMYIGLVFLCIALTVLSVQQLSDSAKYRYRYQVLAKIGLGRRAIHKTVCYQLFGYYLCPALFSAVVSGIVASYVGSAFNFYTGVSTPVFQYFGLSFLLFFGVYAVYFAATYVGFIRNIEDGCR